MGTEDLAEVASDEVTSDEEVASDEDAAKALGSLEVVPSGSALWDSIVELVNQRSEGHIKHYRKRVIVKKISRIPESAIFKEMEQQAKTLGKPTRLFHGTGVEIAAKIIKGGFQLPNRHAHGGMFGKGIYFAETPLKSAVYTAKEGLMSQFTGWLFGDKLSSGGRQMLLCDVYLGRPWQLRLGGRPRLNPEVDLKGGMFSKTFGLGDYNSVCAPGGLFGAVNVTEHIVYKPHQAIPKYLIEFESEYARS